ncbi:MAG: Coenzyme F420 hydrogenase/dehydrogenase, beta subunit C-terminal domain [Methylibium sp.]|uniref:Coenzyme F420 hydrogenase/dehydrogenase, beta subunit C-terminal domain n=1 Tax=Methylibium sp. TaxID=2067992 RepID=UPI0017E33760|nr:Coenzyme F420 hydrogenase/dehydrogenase, beta subunit C-terminal domain [Methylibium sp.]
MTAGRFGIRQVVDEGFCVGCGACAAAARDPAVMRWTPFELYQADLAPLSERAVDALSPVCPFSDDALDEDRLAEQLWPDMPAARPGVIGRYLSVGAGRVVDEGLVKQSSSGGLTSYVLRQLLERGLVDGIIHVGNTEGGPNGAEGPLMGYRLSYRAEDVARNSKSRYYPIEMSRVLAAVRGDGKRYALVGVPCFIKAARLLCRDDEALRQQLVFMVGLVCGHLKSGAFARNFAWQMGVPPERLGRFDFRVKDEQKSANAYSVAAIETSTGRMVQAPSRTLFGSDWGLAMFRPRACDFCDDIAGELADVCFGDAWLPQYEGNWRGTNIHVLRNEQLAAILKEGEQRGDIVLFDSDADEFVASQGGNYRHRREGVQVRLADRNRARQPAPRKRQFGVEHRTALFKRLVYRARVELGDRSHGMFRRAVEAGDYAAFRAGMKPALRRYRLFAMLSSGRVLAQMMSFVARRFAVRR